MIRDFSDPNVAVPPALTVLDGPRVARTMVEVAFAPAATVGQVDSVLSAIGGRIAGSLAGVAILEVQIPDPGTLAGLHAVIGRLERARGVVRYVNEAVMSGDDALPSDISAATASDLQKVAGSLAINAPAAWNAAGAINPANRPTVVVGDDFGGGQPDGALAAAGLTASMFATGSPQQHGYAVAGVIAGSFGGDMSGRGQVTGVFPATTRMSVVDRQLLPTPTAGVPDPLFQDKLIQAVKATPGNVVVNTSQNDCNSTDTTQVCPTGAALRGFALAWIEKVRGTGSAGVAGAGLEAKFLQTTSAGNIRKSGPTDSESNSAFAAAHELTGLIEKNGTPVPPLSNVLTVEGDFAQDPASSPPGIDCLDATSKRPGDVSAVGDVQNVGGVWTLTGATAGAGPEGGTSFATPQVAGLAEYVWTIEPRLSPQQLAQLLKDTAQGPFLSPDPGCATTASAPAIDAYQALLSLDTTQLPLPGTDQPVRSALLDSNPVPGNPRFDELDLSDFIPRYFDQSSGNSVAPTTRDYSRWDLNGDGFTGGSTVAPFDLDRTGSTLWGKTKLTNTVTQSILGLDVAYNEPALTDLDILCYYAYSPLYLGNTQFRDTQLGPHCLPKINLGANFPSTVIPGTATPLTIRVTRPDFPVRGQTSLQPGVRIELSATGGTVDLPNGTTDSGGSLHANATLASASTPLTIKIVARAGQAGPILDTTTVTATSGQTSVQLISRETAATAVGTATVNQTDGSQKTVTDQHMQIAPTDTFDPFSGSASAAGTVTNSIGDKASFQGAATVEASITTSPGGTPLSVQSDGACDDSIAFTQVSSPSDIAADQVQSGGDMILRFKIVGTPLHYDMSSTSSGTPFVSQRAGLQALSGDFGEIAAGDGNFTGTLDPGTYAVSDDAICASDESQSYSITFTLTQ